MRLAPLQFILIFAVASSTLLLCGCSDPAQPKGPELGSVQAYLDEHPEAMIEEEVASEEEEFAASEEE